MYASAISYSANLAPTFEWGDYASIYRAPRWFNTAARTTKCPYLICSCSKPPSASSAIRKENGKYFFISKLAFKRRHNYSPDDLDPIAYRMIFELMATLKKSGRARILDG